MGVPWAEDGARIGVTGRVEIAGSELAGSKYLARERTAEETVGAQVTRSPTGTVQSVLCTGSAIGPHFGIPHREYSMSYPWANLVALPSVCWPHVSATC